MDTSKTIDDAASEDKPGAQFFAGLAKEFAKNLKIEVEFKSGGEMSTSYSTPLASALVTKNGTWKVTKASGNDVTVSGNRERDIVTGMTVPPKLALMSLIDIAMKPKWVYKHLTTPMAPPIALDFDGDPLAEFLAAEAEGSGRARTTGKPETPQAG